MMQDMDPASVNIEKQYGFKLGQTDCSAVNIYCALCLFHQKRHIVAFRVGFTLLY